MTFPLGSRRSARAELRRFAVASKALKRRSLNASAFAFALVFHLLVLAALAWVRPLPRLELPDGYVPGAPYEVFVAPGLEPLRSATQGQNQAGRPGAAAAPAAQVETAPTESQAQPQPTPQEPSEAPPPQLAPAPTPLQFNQPPSIARPAPPTELRPAQTPELPVPEPPLPSLAPAPSISIAPPLALRRQARPSPLEPIEVPINPEPEVELPSLAAPSPPVRFTQPPSISRPAAPSLRSAQVPDIPPALPSLATPQRVEIAPGPSLNRPAAPSLRPVQRAELPEPEPVLPSLAARPAPVQIQAAPAIRSPAPAPALRALQRPTTPIPGAAENPNAFAAGSGVPAPAGSPGATGTAPGAAAQAAAGVGAGRPAGAHPGCAIEVLMLLTPDERVRCRNELDALAERQRALRATEAGRGFASAVGGPRIDTMDPSKRAYYDAVAAARDNVRNGAGAAPGLSCNLGALLGGGGGAPGEKIKVPGLPCVITPPTGVLTEESRLTPP